MPQGWIHRERRPLSGQEVFIHAHQSTPPHLVYLLQIGIKFIIALIRPALLVFYDPAFCIVGGSVCVFLGPKQNFTGNLAAKD